MKNFLFKMKIDIESCNLIDSCYRREGYMWSALTLIEATKELETFDLPLAGIDLNISPWHGTGTIDGFVYHANRILKTDLKYPIILDDKGTVCEGWHRIVKAILMGRKSIKAKRLFKMPTHDSYEKVE